MSPPVAQLDRGHPLRYTVYLDAYWAVGAGVLSPAAVPAVFEACWAVCLQTAVPGLPLGQVRLTTILPEQPGRWSPVRGLRKGEFVRVEFCPSLVPLGAGGAGGYSPSNIDRNPSLYLENVCFVAVGSAPVLDVFWPHLGRVAAHEALGHTMMPSWGGRGNLSGHTADPANFLFGGAMAESPRVTPKQADDLGWQLARVRGDGVRSTGKVLDAGIPAWPIPQTAGVSA